MDVECSFSAIRRQEDFQLFQDIRTFPMGSGPVVARLFDNLGWGPIIHERVGPGPCKLPVCLSIEKLTTLLIEKLTTPGWLAAS